MLLDINNNDIIAQDTEFQIVLAATRKSYPSQQLIISPIMFFNGPSAIMNYGYGIGFFFGKFKVKLDTDITISYTNSDFNIITTKLDPQQNNTNHYCEFCDQDFLNLSSSGFLQFIGYVVDILPLSQVPVFFVEG